MDVHAQTAPVLVVIAKEIVQKTIVLVKNVSALIVETDVVHNSTQTVLRSFRAPFFSLDLNDK